MLKRYQVIGLLAVLVVAMCLVGADDYEEAKRQEQHYCDMVQLWKQTNGEQGWPAFNGECK